MAERRGHVTIVTIDNPPVNALHPNVVRQLASRIEQVGDEPDVRCVVLTGAGSKHFVAGGDIDFIRTLDAYRSERYVLDVQQTQDAIGRLPQPVVAALNGSTLGGGLELAMACDIRVAEAHAVLGLPEVSLGIIPGAGGTQNLPRLIPLGAAKLMLFTGDRLTAARAWELGLVQEVVPEGAGVQRALDIADAIASNAPIAVAAAKRAVNVGLQAGVVDGHRLEASLFGPLTETADFREAMSAFAEKRSPHYRRK